MRFLKGKVRFSVSIILVSIISFSIGASFIAASAENVTADILACINRNTGSVRISQVCSPRETPFQWLINGLTGKQGARGTQIISGANANDLESKSLGDIGDYFLASNDSTLYGPKLSTGWPKVGIKLQGPTGPRGEKGEAGAQGIQGVPGAPGVTTIYSSSIVRSVYDSAGAIVGEFYGTNGSSVTVKTGSSIVTYGSDGNISTTGGMIYFDSNCAGKRYSIVDFENQFTTLFPLIYTPEYFINVLGVKVYSPYAPDPIIARVIGPLITQPSYFYADYSNTGSWTCTPWTPNPRYPRFAQELQTFTPQFSIAIRVPFSIR